MIYANGVSVSKDHTYNVPPMAPCKMTWRPLQAFPLGPTDRVSSLDLLGDSNQRPLQRI